MEPVPCGGQSKTVTQPLPKYFYKVVAILTPKTFKAVLVYMNQFKMVT